jgi:hypothetical protein
VDWLKTIFGGSNTEQKSTSTPVDMTPDAFKELRGPFADLVSGWASSGGPSYSGPLTTPAGANENQLLGGLMGDAGGASGRQALLTDTMGGKFTDPNSNPFLNDYIKAAQRPTMQALEEVLGRTLPGRFNLAGHTTAPQGSSAFDRAGAIATRGAADAMGDIATKIGMGAYEGERGRQQQAIALSQAEVDTSIKNLQAQSLPRMIQEMGIERGMAEFNRRTQALLEVLKMMGGAASPTIANKGESTGTSENFGKGIFGSLFPQGMKLPV